MNPVNTIIILLLILGAIFGFKKGFIKSLVSLIGTVAIILLAYKIKNPIANIMLNHFPFLKIGGIYASLKVFNILFYEAVAFLVVLVVLALVLGIIIKISGLFERLLNATIILGLYSKILGAITGVFETAVFIYVALFALSQFNITNTYILESKVASVILEKTPILSHVTSATTISMREIYELTTDMKDPESIESFNQKAISILIKHRIVTKKQIKALINSGKLSVEETPFNKEKDKRKEDSND